MDQAAEERLYDEIKGYPLPQLPFPDLVSPLVDELAAECDRWIDADCPFASKEARDAYRRHRLTDAAASAFPWLGLDEVRPVARFIAFFFIMDDYLDKAGRDELYGVRSDVSAVLAGERGRGLDPGFSNQCSMIRQESLACGMPRRLYQHFVDAVSAMMAAIGDERPYNAAGRPPPLAVYRSLRRQTSGGIPLAKYACMQKGYRRLPDAVLLDRSILRMHELAADLIGFHNDFVSLPKELAREGDVINLVLAVRHEAGLGLEAAWREALRIHDECLDEFVQLQSSLPDFGEWQQTAREYATDLGILVQGLYSWHVKRTGRYAPGAYVEPEC